jgi:tripartite ATP-independent transporter DctM subunit
LLIFYAILTEQSVGDLFIAGIGPGLLLTAVFCVMIAGMARYMPAEIWSAGKDHQDDTGQMPATSGEILQKALPITLLVVLVFGGIYGGVFTAIEAGGMGAFAAFLFALGRRTLTLKIFAQVMIDTGHITASLLFLIVAASMYSRMLGVSGLPTELTRMIMESGAGYVTLLLIYVALVIVLGTVIDSVSIMAITVPLFLAALKPFGIDLVWFGIVTVIAVEIGLLTPPLGLSVYVVHSTLARSDITLRDIFIGAGPFVIAMLLVLLLVIVFP